tara:strand:+ start:428 stop:721 length:294 start_codon:yes stop_codon:yes gene_type:complete
MKTVTEKELEVMKNFIIQSAGAFDDLDNQAIANAKDISDDTGYSLNSVGGIFTSLLDKRLIQDLETSYRGATLNDFLASYGECMDYPQIVSFIKEDA